MRRWRTEGEAVPLVGGKISVFSVNRTDLQKVSVDLSLRRVDHHSSVDLLSSQAGAARGKVTVPGKPGGSKLAKAARKAFSIYWVVPAEINAVPCPQR
jgi:hypothetical protein